VCWNLLSLANKKINESLTSLIKVTRQSSKKVGYGVPTFGTFHLEGKTQRGLHNHLMKFSWAVLQGPRSVWDGSPKPIPLIRQPFCHISQLKYTPATDSGSLNSKIWFSVSKMTRKRISYPMMSVAYKVGSEWRKIQEISMSSIYTTQG